MYYYHYAMITHTHTHTHTVRIWDVRPFAPAERQLRVFQGHQHNFEKVYTYTIVQYIVCTLTVQVSYY